MLLLQRSSIVEEISNHYRETNFVATKNFYKFITHVRDLPHSESIYLSAQEPCALNLIFVLTFYFFFFFSGDPNFSFGGRVTVTRPRFTPPRPINRCMPRRYLLAARFQIRRRSSFSVLRARHHRRAA